MANEERIPLIDATTIKSKLNRSGAIFTWSHINVRCRSKTTCASWLRKTQPSPGRILLNDVSGIARPGQILAIMGSSGVGKTTLLKVLSGQDDPRTTVTTGEISLNGQVLTSSQRSNGSIIGHVEQQELFVETMSSKEHLTFQAMLRMEQSITDVDRRMRVHTMMNLLSLDQTSSTLISQLSGGERKRLTFATVLLTDPSIVLIDEPTSGLDTYLAMRLMNMIRKIAVEQQRTIIVVLHQPTAEMFALVDSLCLVVHGGRQAYFGDKNKASQFFADECHLSASSLDHYIEQLAETPDAGEDAIHRGTVVANHFAQSTVGKTLDRDIFILSQQSVDGFNIKEMEEWRSTLGRQLKWLLWCKWLSYRNYPTFTVKSMFRILALSLIYGILFFHLRSGKAGYEKNLNAISLLMMLVLLDGNMSIILINIPAERARINRDYKRRIYSLTAYYMVRVFTDACYAILTSFLSTLVVILLVGMTHGALVIIIVIIEVLTACALCSFIAALTTKSQMGILILQPLQISFMQVSGYFLNLRFLPPAMKWFKYLSYMYYSYSLILMTQWYNGPCSLFSTQLSTLNITNNRTVCVETGQDVLDYYGVNIKDFNFDICILLIMIFTFHLAAFTITVIRIRRIP